MGIPRVISVSGKAGAGKTSIVREMEAMLREMGYLPRVVSFAEPVKSVSRKVLLALDLISEDTPEDEWKAKYRGVPQVIGTHLRGYHRDMWVDLAVNRIKDIVANQSTIVVLNDDCRFPNEAYALHGLGGKLVRVTTDEQIRRSRLRVAMDEMHSSETALDGFTAWDLEVFQRSGDIHPPKAYAQRVLSFFGFQHPGQQVLG